jgi:hypothetical protein
MYRKVKKYIKECDACNKNKIENQKPRGKMQSEKSKPERPWEKITADFLEMPLTKHPYLRGKWDVLLVIVDEFSKQSILIPNEENSNN